MTPSSTGALPLKNLFADRSFANALEHIQESVCTRLKEHIAMRQQRSISTPDKLYDAMSYGVVGGKRLRSYLCLASCYALGYRFCDESMNLVLLDLCCALECLQAYSLVHDDLPGMDNADLRRGKPSVHKQFDHHTAILAGSALQNLAFEIISMLDIEPQKRCALLQTLLVTTGGEGMMGGQQWDMDFEVYTQEPDADRIETMLSLKTGAFFQGCTSCAWILFGHGHPDTKKVLQTFSHHFGLLYQLVDDLSDVTSTPEGTGKPTGHDTHKKTLLTLQGVDQTRASADHHARLCKVCTHGLPEGCVPLNDLIDRVASAL